MATNNSKDEMKSVKAQSEAEPRKSEFAVLWLFVAALLILTAVAGYVLWKKISNN